jgi:glucosamine 6-phosphate synthetase-like amidotransferase/phosphosugar isomerase protein
LVDALKRLEYRSYDSAGLRRSTAATLRPPPGHRQAGQPARLAGDPLVPANPATHRWATHGAPSVTNASAPRSRVAVVHNGIIENSANCAFLQATASAMETDTMETVALLAQYHL